MVVRFMPRAKVQCVHEGTIDTITKMCNVVLGQYSKEAKKAGDSLVWAF